MRIFHFGMLLNSLGISITEKKLGYISHLGERKTSLYNFKLDYNLNFNKGNFITKLWRAVLLFIRIRSKYDVFHFQYGTSILDFDYDYTNHLDLPFYPKSAKLVFTFNGDDCRLKYPIVDGIDFNLELKDYLLNKNHFNLKRRITKIAKVEKYAHKIYAVNPDLLNFLPNTAEFVPYTIPNIYNIQKVERDFFDNPFIIIHAPTNRDVKGSKYIISALKEIESEFYFVKVILVENTPYEKALKIYEKAHLVIDQVVIGWYGALSVEVMRMGIPVACYLRHEDFRFIPQEMEHDLCKSVINISPKNIVDPIREVLLDRSKLQTIGLNGYNYSLKWHDVNKIASNIIKNY